MNAILRLAHAICLDPYPSIREWHRTQDLARAALAEHDALCVEAERLRKVVANIPKHQGMVELA